MNFKEKPLSTEHIFSGHIMDVEVTTVQLPSGEQATREIVRHAPAVAILAITPNHEMLLMRQWRAPVNQETLEIPAGKLDERDGNDMLKTAKRELNEETRFEAEQLQEVSGFYTSIGFSDEYMGLFLATGLKPVKTELPQDEDEQLELLKVSLTEALKMIANHEIEDAKTIMAIYYWQTLILRGELNG